MNSNENKKATAFPGLAGSGFSWKGGLISSLELIRRDHLMSNQDILLTLMVPGVMLQCKLSDIGELFPDESKGEQKEVEFDLSPVIRTYDDAVSSRLSAEPDTRLIDDGAVLNLRNVSIYTLQDPGRCVMTMDQVFVFVSQVIGFTLAPQLSR